MNIVKITLAAAALSVAASSWSAIIVRDPTKEELTRYDQNTKFEKSGPLAPHKSLCINKRDWKTPVLYTGTLNGRGDAVCTRGLHGRNDIKFY